MKLLKDIIDNHDNKLILRNFYVDHRKITRWYSIQDNWNKLLESIRQNIDLWIEWNKYCSNKNALIIFNNSVSSHFLEEKIKDYLIDWNEEQLSIEPFISKYLLSNTNISNLNIYKGDYKISNAICNYSNVFIKNTIEFTADKKSLNFTYDDVEWSNGEFAFLKWSQITKLNIINNTPHKKVYFNNITISDNKSLEWISSEVILWNIEIWELKLLNFSNYGSNFELRNLTIANLVIENSDLWKMKFNWVNITDTFSIDNVVLNDCIFNGVDFPEELKDIWNNQKLKDNYRQLKFVMDKNWNHTEANKFYAKEMKTYRNSIDPLKLWFNKIFQKGFNWKEAKKLWSIISLWFSYQVNDFGNNWIRPLFFIILLALFGTMIDGFSTMINPNINGDILTIIIIGIILFLDILKPKLFNKFKFLNKLKFLKFLDNSIDKTLSTILSHFLWFILFFVVMIWLLSLSSADFDWLKVFWNLLNPLYVLEQFRVTEIWRFPIYYNWIEIFAFTLYKIMYSILLWHLLVAAKRTTRR